MHKTMLLALAACVLATAACGSSSSPDTSNEDAGDGGGTPTAEAACTASAQAQCALRDACSSNHYLVARTYGDMATCVRTLHDHCLAGLSAPGTGNSPANVMACAGAYPSISCVDYLNGNTDALPASCKPQVGTLADGAPCHYPAQCQSTYCAVPTGLECGTCAALPTPGTPCNGPGAVSGCGGHLLQCTGDISDDRGYSAGTCQSIVTNVGGSCDATHPCGEGLSCTPVGAAATGRTCQTAGNTVGAACGGASNPGCDGAQGLSCNGKTHTCEAIVVAAAGTACGTGADGSFTNCLGDGDCMGATSKSNAGTCRDASADLGSCDVVSGPGCGAGSTCVTGGGATTAGTCQAPSASTCH